MMKKIIVAELMLLCALIHPSLGRVFPRTQSASDDALIRTVQAKFKTEGGNPDAYDYKVLNKLELAESERALLESQKFDSSQINQATLQAYVAIYKREDGQMERVYRVYSTSSGDLDADGHTHVSDLTVEELLKLRKVAEEFTDALLRKSDVSSLFEIWFEPNLFSDVKKLSWMLTGSLFYLPDQGADLLNQLSESERQRLLAAWCNIFMRLTEFYCGQAIIGISTGTDESKLDAALNHFVTQSGVAKDGKELDRLLEEPVTNKQQLLDRLYLWEKTDRAWSAYLQTNNVYNSALYELNMRRLSKRILFANKRESQEMLPIKGTTYATNCLSFSVVFSDINGRMKVVAIGPYSH